MVGKEEKYLHVQRKLISDLATVQMTSNGHVPDKLSIVHEVRQILHLVGGGGQLLLSVGKLVLLNGSYDWLRQRLSVLFLNYSLGGEEVKSSKGSTTVVGLQ